MDVDTTDYPQWISLSGTSTTSLTQPSANHSAPEVAEQVPGQHLERLNVADGFQIPPRLRARLKPIHLNDQPDAILHKIKERQQRAAIQREVVLQEKKRSARIPLAKLSAWANITKEALGERQKKAYLRREEKVEEKVKKATALKKSLWFSTDQVTPKATVDSIRERLSQADERRQVFKDLKLKMAKESEQSHWYSQCKLKPKLTAEQLLEKQAKAEDRRRQHVENRLHRMQKCEEETKKIVEMMEPLVLSVSNEEVLQ